eukprot:g11939.t2
MFQKLTTDGYLGGKRAVGLLGKSGLPQQTLARVWTLADGDADGSPDGDDGPHAAIPESNESPVGEISVGGRRDSSDSNQPTAVPVDHQTEQGSANEKRETPAGHMIVGDGAIRAPDESFQISQTIAVEGRDHGAPDRKRRPKLRQLDAKNVDAVFAEDPGTINSLRDVQSWRILVMGLQRLSEKDMSRRIPVKPRSQRRHTLPLVTTGELVHKQEFLPGRGRRTSLFGTAYDPAALFLKKRAERGSTREVELEKDIAKAAKKWNLKPLVESAHRDASGATDAEQGDGSQGNLSVAGLPLLGEDIDVIAHLLRQNHAFNKLDLSKCFLSEKQFVSLAQALAWNSRVEELHLQECVFTDVGTAALADVLVVNNHIHSIDVRGCTGLDEKGIRQILRAARKKANLLKFNGMELAALRAESSNELDLSGRGLGYVEAVVVADCLRTRADGLEKVDLHDNLLSTEAFATLMVPLLKQSQLRSLDLSQNMIDERALPQVAELLRRNSRLANVNLTDNRISCNEFEHYGIYVMKLLSSNNTVTVFDVEHNNVSPKMLTIIAEKLAANRAVRRDMTFVDCLHLKYPRIAPRPVLADPRRLHLAVADAPFMAQEGIPAIRTTVRTEHETILTVNGVKAGAPLDLFFIHQCSVEATREEVE